MNNNILILIKNFMNDLYNELFNDNDYARIIFIKDNYRYLFKWNNHLIYIFDINNSKRTEFAKNLFILGKGNGKYQDAKIVNSFAKKNKELIINSIQEYNTNIKPQQKEFINNVQQIRKLIQQLFDTKKKNKYNELIKQKEKIYLSLLQQQFRIFNFILNCLLETNDKLIEQDIKELDNNKMQHFINVMQLWLNNKFK